MSETKTNFKNELKSAASLILTFSLPILQYYHIHQNAPKVSTPTQASEIDETSTNSKIHAVNLSSGEGNPDGVQILVSFKDEMGWMRVNREENQ